MTEDRHSSAIATTGTQAIVQYLEGEGVSHQLIEHEPVMSAGAEASAAHLPPSQVAKTVVLHDGAAYVIAAIPASERLDMRKLRDLLGATRKLRLASEAEIERDFPALEVGAVPPFGPMVPAAEVLDRALLGHTKILCPAGDHRHSVLVDPNDVVRLTAAETADICED
jgi:prolyl-tRNA editing enzyme YbaK/EbsC (Cys-tRNA(Pro) deacylase)